MCSDEIAGAGRVLVPRGGADFLRGVSGDRASLPRGGGAGESGVLGLDRAAGVGDIALFCDGEVGMSVLAFGGGGGDIALKGGDIALEGGDIALDAAAGLVCRGDLTLAGSG